MMFYVGLSSIEILKRILFCKNQVLFVLVIFLTKNHLSKCSISHVLFVDIDDTLSTTFERAYRNRKSTGGVMESFYSTSEIMKDTLLEGALSTLQLFKTVHYHIVVISARGSSHFKPTIYKTTETWLNIHNVPYDELVLVNNAEEKIEYVKGRCIVDIYCVVVDDLSKGYPARFLHDIYRKWLNIPYIQFELFNRNGENNWSNIGRRLDIKYGGVNTRAPTLGIANLYSGFGGMIMERAKRSGMEVVPINKSDHVWIMKTSMRNRDRSMKPFGIDFLTFQKPGQCINIINGFAELADQKMVLNQHMMEINSSHVPLSFRISKMDYYHKDFKRVKSLRPMSMWVFKSDFAPNGKSVHVLRKGEETIHIKEILKRISASDATGGLVQQYISPPYLLQNKKVDMRAYAIIASTDPLLVYLHRISGYWRTAAHEYTEDLRDIGAHVTNADSVDGGLRMSHTDFVEEHKKNNEQFLSMKKWKNMGECVIEAVSDAIVSIAHKLGCGRKDKWTAPFPQTCGCWYQPMGLDIIFDKTGRKCYVLEINPDPSPKYRSYDIMVNDEQYYRDMWNLIWPTSIKGKEMIKTQSIISEACRRASNREVMYHCAKLISIHMRQKNFALVFPREKWQFHYKTLETWSNDEIEGYDLFLKYIRENTKISFEIFKTYKNQTLHSQITKKVLNIPEEQLMKKGVWLKKLSEQLNYINQS